MNNNAHTKVLQLSLFSLGSLPIQPVPSRRKHPHDRNIRKAYKYYLTTSKPIRKEILWS